MSIIRRVACFLVVLTLASSELNFSIYKLECIDEKDSNYTKNITCHLKTVSRGLNVLTSYSDFVKPVYYMNGNVQVLQKSSANTYRNVIVNNSIEVCSMLGDSAPPLLKFCLPLISKFAPDLIRTCPYEGRRIGVENLPIDMSLLPLVYISSIPKGDYRVDITFHDKWWNIIHWIKLYGAIQNKRFKKKSSNSSTSTISPNADD